MHISKKLSKYKIIIIDIIQFLNIQFLAYTNNIYQKIHSEWAPSFIDHSELKLFVDTR